MRHPLPFFCLTFGGKVFLFFLLESVNFISRLLLLFHLECDQRLIEIEARFLYIFIISPLVDIITTGGSLFKKVFFLEIISCMSRSDFAVFIFLSFSVSDTHRGKIYEPGLELSKHTKNSRKRIYTST